ncbi:hypothetical protein [Cetobacterium sp.]|uniref:hypothetical protein n=2 Tax=Cetobacterium sp. TaxID=2071632 RepID=UPI002FCC2209
MKVNINTNHLRIYKLLSFSSYKTIDFISEFLKMDRQNVILYIKQIYSFVESKQKKINTQSIINEIINEINLIDRLKECQKFTKKNRVFYIILILLRDKYINLNTLAIELDVSRRVLSNDLIHAKNMLKMYDLKINSSNAKGISLSGNIKNLKIASLSYLYKFFIEFDYLPNIIIKDFESFFCQTFKTSLDNDIELFINNFNFDFFCQNKSLLKAFFIVYVNPEKPSEPTLKELNFEKFQEYFKEVITLTHLKVCFDFFQNSFLGNILLKDIDTFLETLKFCNGDLKSSDIILTKEMNRMKSLIFKNLSVLIKTDSFLEKFINKVTLANCRSNLLSICEMEFLDFNLSEKDRSECIKLFFTLRKLYPNVQFSNIIFLYIWSYNEKNIYNIKNALVVFKSIPQFLFPILKNRLLLKENMNVLDFIKPYELDDYLANKDINCIITFENLNLENDKNSIIKTFNFPML